MAIENPAILKTPADGDPVFAEWGAVSSKYTGPNDLLLRFRRPR